MPSALDADDELRKITLLMAGSEIRIAWLSDSSRPIVATAVQVTM